MKIFVTITNCCYMRGGGRGWNRKPYRVRKYQNRHLWVNEEILKTSHKQLLDTLSWHLPSHYWITSTSKVKRPKTS